MDEVTEKTGPETKTDLSGRTLGDFQLIRLLGQGGMGQVYLARQLSLKRQVAIKILKSELAANTTALQRFRLEAESVAKINHANIVQIYAIGESENLHYMALEYVEGKNLRDYLNKKGPPELPIALNIMRQVAAALQRASELRIVHRDVKPENILLTRKGEVKVTDFGLSRCFSQDQPLHLTQSGVTMGTPLYMSPEQVQGKPVDPRSDIYSFGITCYHLLAGEPPFRGTNSFEVALQHVQANPKPLREIRPDLPAEVCLLVHKMITKRPEDRYQSARDVLRDLTRLREQLFNSNPTTPGISISNPAVRVEPATNPSAATTPIPISTYPTNRPFWPIGLLLVMLASVVGAGLHWFLPSSHSASNPTRLNVEAEEENLHQKWFAEKEKTLLKRIDSKDLRFEVILDDMLELLQLYIHEKKWETAEQFCKSWPSRGIFTETNVRLPIMKEERLPLARYGEFVKDIGFGILYAHQNKPAESNREFNKAINDYPAKKTFPGRFLEAFLRQHMKWRKEIADALERNAKNLGPKMDPNLDKYRTYSAPKILTMPDKK